MYRQVIKTTTIKLGTAETRTLEDLFLSYNSPDRLVKYVENLVDKAYHMGRKDNAE